MTENATEKHVPATVWWRNTRVRALLYQVVFLGGVALFALFLVSNTIENREKRGIASGWGFLENEAGYPIPDPPPVPMVEGTFLIFILTLVFGLAVSFFLDHRARKQGLVLGDDLRQVALVVFLLLVLPAAVLYFGAGSIHLEAYDESKPYWLGLKVGMINTLKISILGCILATLLGLVIGVARLSSNWLIARLGTVYVEIVRNIPLLLQIFFWYHVLISVMPGVRDSITVGDILFLNQRGINMVYPVPQAGAGLFGASIYLVLLGGYAWHRFVRHRQEQTGQQLPQALPILAALVLIPGAVFFAAAPVFQLDYPVLEGFNFTGGATVSPEYSALLFALVIYTASFIAEIVRSGIQAISKGQIEAASAVGLRAGLVMRLVVLPQALRVIVPPLTSQYLNLTKNSSLAVAIGYSELVSIGGTTMNQTGQAVEVVAIWMGTYLTLSLLTSLFMNWYNTKVKLVER